MWYLRGILNTSIIIGELVAKKFPIRLTLGEGGVVGDTGTSVQSILRCGFLLTLPSSSDVSECLFDLLGPGETGVHKMSI